ncbi:cation:proton antiporter [Pseudactinotalea sp. Z1732]|uniref:cation:proton antiporter n=1 Tax=Pseudactinotalea sp. Z1732 TaxID=3413026 RepID=UPI003C7DA93C
MTVWEIIGQVLILAGTVLFAVAGLGLFQFFDVYTRISAVGTAAGLGVALVVVGALCLQPGLSHTVKVAAIVVFQLTTSAVATSAIARAAYLSRAPLRRLSFDQLTPTEPDTRAGEED